MNITSASSPSRFAFGWPQILGLAFVLRVAGIHYGLPFLYHQDEPILVNHALSVGSGGWNTHFFVIPPFMIYYLFALYGAYYALGTVAGLFGGVSDFIYAFAADPTPFYLLGRFFAGVLFGTATVAAVYHIGRRYISATAGTIAALFLAVFPMHVQQSHYIYADIPVAFALALLLWALFRIAERPGLKSYIWMGAIFGWAVSIKYTAAYMLPAIVAAHVAAHRGGWVTKDAWGKAAASAAASLAVFAIIAPFTFLDAAAFWGQITHQGGAEGPSGLLHHLVYSIAGGIGTPALFLAAAGAVVIVKTRPRIAAVILTACAAYYTVNIFFSQNFARYMMPLLPPLALLAGAGWEWVGARMAPVLKKALLAGLLLSMLVPSVYSDLLFLQEDTRTACLKWFEQHVPQGSVVVRDNRFFSPALRQTPGQVAAKRAFIGSGPKGGSRKQKLDAELKVSEAGKSFRVYTFKDPGDPEPDVLSARPWVDADWKAAEAVGVQYIIVNHSDSSEGTRRFLEQNSRKIERAALFSPYRGGAPEGLANPNDTTAAPHLFMDQIRRRRLGPVLEVYKVRA